MDGVRYNMTTPNFYSSSMAIKSGSTGCSPVSIPCHPRVPYSQPAANLHLPAHRKVQNIIAPLRTFIATSYFFNVMIIICNHGSLFVPFGNNYTFIIIIGKIVFVLSMQLYLLLVEFPNLTQIHVIIHMTFGQSNN